ncbi:MAG: PEP-CTERM sorting domain-containing protein [Planctomycetota bacterium]
MKKGPYRKRRGPLAGSTKAAAAGSMLALGVGLTLGSAQPAHAEIIFFDNFQQAGGNNGQPLAATTPDTIPVGASNWLTNNSVNPRFQAGQVTVSSVTGSRTGYVLDVPVVPTLTMPIVEFTGEINPAGSRWIDVNLYDDDTTPTTGANTQLGIRVRETGAGNTAELRVDNALAAPAVSIDSGLLPFLLTYDSLANTASLTVGGTEIVSGLDLGSFTPAIDGVGLNFQVPQGGSFTNLTPRVDSLQIELVVPEPGTIGLLLSGGLLMLCRSKRNHH